LNIFKELLVLIKGLARNWQFTRLGGSQIQKDLGWGISNSEGSKPRPFPIYIMPYELMVEPEVLLFPLLKGLLQKFLLPQDLKWKCPMPTDPGSRILH
jgi:hypothetical protein